MTVNEMPSHNNTYMHLDESSGPYTTVLQASKQYNHTQNYNVPSATPTINNTGGNAAHNNLQPYITVYMFKRTA